MIFFLPNHYFNNCQRLLSFTSEHKNVIAFISHCGLFSILEAIHTATPVIGIPFMFDQFQDAQILYERGVGIYLDYDTMDKQTFANALKEITTNKK